MFSQIQIGKRKRKEGDEKRLESKDAPAADSATAQSAATSVKQFTDDINQKAAMELRSMLNSFKTNNGVIKHERYEERSARISGPSQNGKQTPSYQSHKSNASFTEDIKYEYLEGKHRSAPAPHLGPSATIQDMIAEESLSKLDGTNMDDNFARNIYRLGSHYKGTDLQQHGPGRSSGADEDDVYGDGGVDVKMFSSNREKSKRQVAILDKDDQCLPKCWWWLQSSSFRKHLLISVGNHVRLQ